MLTTLLIHVHGEQYSNSFLTWLEETHLETFAQVIGSHHHLRHSKVAVQVTQFGIAEQQLNILFSVRKVKRSATINHIKVAEPTSQWQCTVLMQSFYQYNHTSPYKVVLCSTTIFYPKDDWSKPWHVAVVQFHLHCPQCRCYIFSGLLFSANRSTLCIAIWLVKSLCLFNSLRHQLSLSCSTNHIRSGCLIVG